METQSKLEIIKRLQRNELGLVVELKTGEVYQVNNSELGGGLDNILLCRLRRKEIPHRRELERAMKGRLGLEEERKAERILMSRYDEGKLLSAQGEHHYIMWDSIHSDKRRYM